MTQSHSALQPITGQQQTIITLIFTYRFLTIYHLQTFLGHKDKRRIQIWLNDLMAKGYIHQIYDKKNFQATARPALYFIATNGVRLVRSISSYTENDLRKRYADTTRSPSYIDHCLLIATCCIVLQMSSTTSEDYTWLTPTEYALIDASTTIGDFLQVLQPHLYFTRNRDEAVAHYVLEHFHDRLPHAQVRSRIRALLNHDLYDGEEEAPVVLLVCDTVARLLSIKRYVRTLVEDMGRDDFQIRIVTVDQLRLEGVTSPIWEEIV